MKTALAMVCVGVILAGCNSTSGVGRAMSYPAQSTDVAFGGETYRVFEHKTDKTLMTTPTVAKSAAIGVTQTATLGSTNTATLSPQGKNSGAAQQYLNQTGRANCRVTGGKLILPPQYEFTYECPTSAASSGTGGGVVVGGSS